MIELLYPTINLIILITVMVVYLREPLRSFVKTRHETIREELHQVRTLLSRSQARYDEFSSKLKAMDAEIASLRDQARQDGKAAQSRLISEAQKMSATIVSDARASAGGMYSQLRHELLTEIGVKVLDRAQVILSERLTGDDRVRIRREFSSQVETVQ